MTANITFVIPSFRGLNLLQKNLASVIAEAKAGDRIIISEDGPADQENIQAHDNFFAQLKTKLQEKKIDFTFLPLTKNLRFAVNVNQAIALVETDFFLLLNNDVRLEKGARAQLLAPMTDKKVFAVTAQEIDKQTQEHAGRNKLWWSKGRFWHSRDENLTELGETAWACGGSSLYRTKIWRQLKGFDQKNYYPAYWEDIDISYRAQKLGYKVIYQPAAKVIHEHETTNQNVFGAEKIARMSWRNGSRFARKNGNFGQKMSHFFLAPYWLLKQYPTFRYWAAVLLLAVLTRFVALGQIPAGLTVDEAAIAYNGYGIFSQRRDEWLNRLPVSFRSFGDYKAPLAIYLNGFATAIFGHQDFAVRLPFALASVLSVWLMMLLTDLLFQDKSAQHQKIAAVAGFFITIVPWSFHYGRLCFENNFALFFILAGSYFLLKQIKRIDDQPQIYWWQKWLSTPILISGICFVASLYSYHSSKVFLPLWLVFLSIYYWRFLKQNWRLLILPLAVSGLLAWPLLKDSFWGEGLTRANSSFITNSKITTLKKIQLLGNGLITHFTPQYLLAGQLNTIADNQPNVRHGDNHNGVLSLPIVFLILLSLASWLSYKNVRQDNQEIYTWSWALILFGLLPAAMTSQIPHSNQAILALPGFLLLATLGYTTWPNWWKQPVKIVSSFQFLILILAGCSFLTYVNRYQQTFAIGASDEITQEHYLVSQLFAQNLSTAFAYATTQEKNVERIFVATNFEQPYIYALWARGTKPIAYQGGSLSAKYTFVDKISFADLEQNANSLFIVSPDKISDPENFINLEPTQTYSDLNGETNLLIYQSEL
ncbi:MAG: glycosyltransferase [bacterium]|nr:glycosyltransferase [bacterium]